MKTKKYQLNHGLIFLAIIAFCILQSCLQMRTKDKIAQKEFQQKGIAVSFSSIKENNKTIHYVKVGNDTFPTLFFVHGSPGSWTAYKKYMMDEELLKYFRIISIDRPGFGYSNFKHALHLYEQTPIIYRVVNKEQNKKQMHLVGHSIGGPVIVKMAQEHPFDYTSLTVLAGSISPLHEPKEHWRKLAAHFPFKYFLPGAFRPSNKEIVAFKHDLYNLDTNYIVLKMPVMFIHGDKDPRVTVKNVNYGLNKLSFNPNAQSIIIPGANHFIPWQHYAEIKNHLLTLVSYK